MLLLVSRFDWELSEVTNLSKMGQYKNPPSRFNSSGIGRCEERDQKSGGRGDSKGGNSATYCRQWSKTIGTDCTSCHKRTIIVITFHLAQFQFKSSWNYETFKIFCNILWKVWISPAQRKICMRKTRKGINVVLQTRAQSGFQVDPNIRGIQDKSFKLLQ